MQSGARFFAGIITDVDRTRPWHRRWAAFDPAM
ncbi:hypothetical protein GGR48_003575 [Sphingomonas pseudosanguinis]|uniref:Uncharacterized protein n=1 Tax=Sphingomonas pseudosanguinis TaxID=413712 RepID=A0A7W6ADY1_9SPHN|nr:hypothetical protein [Sphingomonas pseudosanguinis]